jgi:ABC-2 type transport system permease protein
MIKNIIILTFNDLAVALKNKTLFLILFIPLFVFLSLRLVDRTDSSKAIKVKIGFIQEYAYNPKIIQNIKSTNDVVEAVWIKSEDEGKIFLKEHKLDGVMIGSTLLVLKKESLHTLAIVQTFSALQKASEGNNSNWITDIKPLHEGGLQRQSLPTWVLMLVLLVGFIILPSQVAEEKEKKLLLAILQTPVHEIQWLIAKLIMGIVLIIISVLLLHLLNNFWPSNIIAYLAFLFVGSYCFSAFGILLGFLCRNQASARTLGLIFYLPLLLPSALSEFSQKLAALAPFLPSYQFYGPLQSILLENGRVANSLFEWIYLFSLGTFLFYLSYLLMKKRWLM